MVDALRSSWTVLRPRGVVIDVRPAAVYRPRLAVQRGPRRLDLGPLQRDPDADVVAAQQATRRTVRDGWFDVVRRTRWQWRARYEDPAALDRMLAENENWHVPAATRRQLANVHTAGDVIEVSRVLSLAILRKRSVVRAGQSTAIR